MRGADVRQAARALMRSRGVTLGAATALALGLAANVLVFSIVDAVLFRPLPYAEPERLVFVTERSSQSDAMAVSYPDYLDWQRDTTTFEAMGAQNFETFNLTGQGDAEQISGANVTASVFNVLGVKPIVGRVFTAEDDAPAAAPVVVLSHDSWLKRFNGDPRVVGRTIVLTAVPRTIVGVMPRGFRFPLASAGEVYSPLGLTVNELGDRGSHPGLGVIARIKRGTTIEQARADLDRVAANLSAAYPATNRDIRSRMERYVDRATGSARPLLIAVWGAVCAVLLVGCASAAALLVAQRAARAREFAMRMALGATRADLLRQVLTESLILSAAAGLAGVIIAAWSLPLVVHALPQTMPRVADVGLDARALAFALVLTSLTGLVAGCWPAWQAGRTPLYQTAAARTEPRAARPRAQATLVIVQLSLSHALLVCAGLLAATLGNLLKTETGFRPAGVATALYYLPDATYTTYERLTGFHEALLDRLSHAPEISAAGLITPPPFGFGSSQSDVTIEGRQGSVKTDSFRVSPAAFAALGVPLIAGRTFDDRDRRDRPPVVIVDERFARAYFPHGHAIGQRIRIERARDRAEIVGVVGHMATRALDYEGRPQIHTPLLAGSLHFAAIVARAAGPDAASALPALRRSVRGLDPELPLFSSARMTDLIDATTGAARLAAMVFAAFAGVAWLLASLGLAGIIGYSVTLRTRELGIRLALGAAPWRVVAGIVSYGTLLTLAGLCLGIAGGVAAGRMLSSLLVGVGPLDPFVLAAASLTLLATGIAASYVPARRVARLDPISALRAD